MSVYRWHKSLRLTNGGSTWPASDVALKVSPAAGAARPSLCSQLVDCRPGVRRRVGIGRGRRAVRTRRAGPRLRSSNGWSKSRSQSWSPKRSRSRRCREAPDGAPRCTISRPKSMRVVFTTATSPLLAQAWRRSSLLSRGDPDGAVCGVDFRVEARTLLCQRLRRALRCKKSRGKVMGGLGGGGLCWSAPAVARWSSRAQRVSVAGGRRGVGGVVGLA
jgi:hypothetical protein